MNHDSYDDAYLRGILEGTKTIALVGASPNPMRPSNAVMAYLLGQGYHVIPVNPGHAGGLILGQPVYANLAAIPEPVDLVDVFRRNEALASVVDETLALDPLPKAIWIQLGLRDDRAAAKAEAAGIQVVMDRCAKVEQARLLGNRSTVMEV